MWTVLMMDIVRWRVSNQVETIELNEFYNVDTGWQIANGFEDLSVAFILGHVNVNGVNGECCIAFWVNTIVCGQYQSADHTCPTISLISGPPGMSSFRVHCYPGHIRWGAITHKLYIQHTSFPGVIYHESQGEVLGAVFCDDGEWMNSFFLFPFPVNFPWWSFLQVGRVV